MSLDKKINYILKELNEIKQERNVEQLPVYTGNGIGVFVPIKEDSKRKKIELSTIKFGGDGSITAQEIDSMKSSITTNANDIDANRILSNSNKILSSQNKTDIQVNTTQISNLSQKVNQLNSFKRDVEILFDTLKLDILNDVDTLKLNIARIRDNFKSLIGVKENITAKAVINSTPIFSTKIIIEINNEGNNFYIDKTTRLYTDLTSGVVGKISVLNNDIVNINKTTIEKEYLMASFDLDLKSETLYTTKKLITYAKFNILNLFLSEELQGQSLTMGVNLYKNEK